MALKGLKADKKIKYIWIFAVDQDDFKQFCGSAFVIQKGGYKGRYGSWDSDGNTFYLHGIGPGCIKGRVNIAYEFTDRFMNMAIQSGGGSLAKNVERELAICNFKSNKTVNFDILPNVIKELMSD